MKHRPLDLFCCCEVNAARLSCGAPTGKFTRTGRPYYTVWESSGYLEVLWLVENSR